MSSIPLQLNNFFCKVLLVVLIALNFYSIGFNNILENDKYSIENRCINFYKSFLSKDKDFLRTLSFVL